MQTSFARSRHLLDLVAEKLEIQSQLDWYHVSSKEVKKKGAFHLIQKYSSLFNALRTLYPEFDWNEHLFQKKSHNHWNCSKNRRQLFDWIGETLGIQTQEDWYKTTVREVIQVGGSSVLSTKYHNSLYQVLSSIYDEFEWNPLLFHQVPKHHWENPENRKELFDSLAIKLGIKTREDWYNVSSDYIEQNGGAGLLRNYYNNSMRLALQSIYPDYDWKEHLFQSVPKHYWQDTNNQRKYLEWIGQQFNINQFSDWFDLSRRQLLFDIYLCLITSTDNWSRALQKTYPEYIWYVNLRREGQSHLQNTLKALTQTEIIVEYGLVSSDTTYELDLYLPQHSVAFEYQGEQHYSERAFSSTHVFSQQKLRDEQKRKTCERMGITLVSIPYWWNSSIPSLVSVIHKHINT